MRIPPAIPPSLSRALATLACGSAVTVLAACGGGSYSGNASNTTAAPSITQQPVSVTVQAGQTATFRVTASSGTPVTYQWVRGTNDIAGATSATYSFAATPADNGATFQVRVTNSYATATSVAATLTVQ